MPTALAILAACAPVTAAIVKLVPTRETNGNGKYVTLREFVMFKENMYARLARIEAGVDSLNLYLRRNK